VVVVHLACQEPVLILFQSSAVRDSSGNGPVNNFEIFILQNLASDLHIIV
jgi:hypothetical protein